MKLIFSLAFAFVLQFSFAQKTLPQSYAQKPFSPLKASFTPDTLIQQEMVSLRQSSMEQQPCSGPTIIQCGETLYNQDNYGVGIGQAKPVFWSSNFSSVHYENCDINPLWNYNAPDRLFRFTLAFPATVNIHMENISGGDLDMFLLSNCFPAECVSASTFGGGSNEDISYYLNPGTYYIVVDGYNFEEGTFDLSLDFEGGCTRPCENSTMITCGQTLLFQNNKTFSGWVSNFDAFDYGDCGTPLYNYEAPDRIYQFELQGEAEVTISLDILNQAVDLDLFLMSYCEPPICYEKSINSTQFDDELIIVTLNPGVYYIVVDGFNYAEGDYHLSLQCGCNSPTTLNCGPILTGQTTAGQPNNYSANTYSACGISGVAPYGAPDKLYTFTLNQTEEVNISMEVLSANTNLDVFLLSSCNPAICYAYSNNTAPFESIQATLPPGTYYVIVDGFNGSQGNFNIQLSCNCTCIEALDLGVLRSCEGFEGFANNTLVSPNSVRWNKWSTTAGDAFVRSASGNKYLEMKPAGTPTPDVWFNLGTNATARYRLSFEMRVDTGKNGIYYVQHQAPNASGANSNTAYRVIFNSDGIGFVRLGLSNTNVATFSYPNGEWVDVVQIIDMSLDVAELWIDGEFVHAWKFSVGSNGSLLRLESLSFDADDASFSYRVDNICFRGQGPCTIPPTIDPICIENGAQYNNQTAAKCKLYTKDEEQPCANVCQFGGRFIYRGDNFSGTFDASDRAPSSVLTQPCVLQAYGNNLPPKLYADIYIFARQDNKNIGVNFSDNGNPNVRAFVFVCDSDEDNNGTCVDGEVCWEVIPSGGGSNVAINTCSEFYYVVITGTLGETYSNLNIIPNGNCPPNPPLIACGATVAGTVGTGNAPSIPFNNTTTYLQCYAGQRTYTGDESFYKFVLNQPTKVTINLTASAPNPSAMGVFLFSFLCGGNCLGYAENSAVNPSAKLEANLNEGIYYLVVDKDILAGNPNFTLNVTCENYPFLVTFTDFTGDLNCPSDAVAPPHIVSLKASPNYVDTDYFEFYYRDTNGQLTNNIEANQYWHNSSQPQNFSLRKDNEVADQLKCSYLQGDTFYVFMHQADNNGTFKQFLPTFAPSTGGGVTDSLKFRPGGFSFITKLTEISAINFVPEFSTLSIPSAASTRTMLFSSGEPWAVEKVNGPANWLTIDPTENTSAQKLT
ncbi:MAG: PPC domain-containing protein, partial [Saprospiraceae bacterium]